MGLNSKIEWTDDTWNCWQGCKRVSPGCSNCYMYRDKKRYGQDPMKIVRSAPATFNAPLTKLKGPLVFVCSWSDFFIEEADEWRQEAWNIIRKTPHLTYQILTKRVERIPDCLSKDWGNGYPNVWLGVSVEHGGYLWRMDVLRKIPAALRFVSAEPLLGPLVLDLRGFNWVITGGESGPNYRPAREEWFLDIRDQCEDAGVSYFHKQGSGARGGDNKLAGRVYDDIPIHKPVEIQREMWAPWEI